MRHDIFGVFFKSLWVHKASEKNNDFALQGREEDDPLLLAV